MGDHGYWASRPDSLRLSSSVSGTRLGVLRAFSLGLVVLRCLCCLRQASALMLFITEQSTRRGLRNAKLHPRMWKEE